MGDQSPVPVWGGGPRRLLWCDLCSLCLERSQEDLLRYTRDGWPQCCGQVMTVFAESERPAPRKGPSETPTAGPISDIES